LFSLTSFSLWLVLNLGFYLHLTDILYIQKYISISINYTIWHQKLSEVRLISCRLLCLAIGFVFSITKSTGNDHFREEKSSYFVVKYVIISLIDKFVDDILFIFLVFLILTCYVIYAVNTRWVTQLGLRDYLEFGNR